MKTSYITVGFQKTVARCFPAQADALKTAFSRRLTQLRQENADATEEKQRHLENQILPGIAAYETLQKVMPKEQALKTVHGYVEQRAWKMKKLLLKLMRIPRLYRCVPKTFTKQVPRLFGEMAGFESKEIQAADGVWRMDMTKCPYHDTCVRYGCPELCSSFCDSDDIAYGDLHPRLLWQRTKTLGRGGDCCDFCLKVMEK
ncbi:MAG: L-2-amino-thiazoline-4-carboxylic acid hydrolase [Eubacteriales bacterium]|nr:L-2-amino-thiazoline-4-carboxylic acid hydrolase [Eubacteriales bacterium]